jgi:hypothetical protein
LHKHDWQHITEVTSTWQADLVQLGVEQARAQAAKLEVGAAGRSKEPKPKQKCNVGIIPQQSRQLPAPEVSKRAKRT